MQAHSILGRVLFGATLVASGLACDLEEPEGRPVSEDFTSEADEIVENLRLAGFPEEEIQVFGDRVVLGYDAEVSLQASREMAGVRRIKSYDGDEDRQYATNNLVSQSVDTICIDGSAFENNSSLNAGLDNAIANYNSLGLGFSMKRTSGNTSGCDAVIDTNISGSGGGSAGFRSNGKPYGLINVGGSMNVPNATHVIQHELGHCIGFRHTDYYDRSISCGSGGNEGSSGVGANHIPGTPQTAVMNGSVMNACYNGGSDGEWTNSDIVALEYLYPGGSGGDGGGDGSDGGGDGGGGGESCGGRCGNYDAAFSCQCDSKCAYYGDCCGDKVNLCDAPPPPQPGPDSCVNRCGGKSTSCWCDSQCANYGDCCENKKDICE